MPVENRRTFSKASRQRPVFSHASEMTAVKTINQSVVRLAYACCVLRHCVQHRLQVRGRAGDDAQNFTCGGLLGKGLSKVMVSCIYLSKQLAIFKRHRRLVNESLDQGYLFIGERAYF